jgi:ribose transport system permease protein
MKQLWPIFAVLVVLLAAIAFVNPNFLDPPVFLAFLKRAAPLALLAAGQYFVIVSGEFDLSVGSLITAEVVIAARLINGDADATWWVIVLLLVIGVLIGLVNGTITTRFGVPSFIATLGMLLILEGAVFLWTDGAPRGALSDEFRMFGRNNIVGQIPWSVVILVLLGTGAVLLMRSDFGRSLMATGDNPKAANLAGVRVPRIRTTAFVLSGLSAAVAAVLLGGFGGVSAQVGRGLEFAAITAVVLGGVALGGGRGSVVGAMAGALTVESLFTLLNLLGVSGALEYAVQGLIIIAAVAFTSRRTDEHPRSGRGVRRGLARRSVLE